MSAAGCGVLDDPVEERWEARSGFPSCGEVALEQGEDLREQAAGEIACLRRSLESGEGAEMGVTYPTVEGAPVRDHYRLTPQGRLEVYTDATDDPHSDGKWSFAECYEPQWLAEVSCTR
ncbi:hypothetical protein ACLIYP_05320 [Streptomyces nanhaiensis]|uniref:hypothetical protein n=1 Tax=Streptomyces nanhaiensis TaxID=679319 RepID=UPI00399C726D